MGKGFMEKILNFIGFESDDEEDLPEEEVEPEKHEEEPLPEEPEYEDDEPRDMLWAKKRKGSVVALPQKSVKEVVVELSSFDEVPGIAEHLRNRRPVLVNLEAADKDVARRIIDFLSGTTYAIVGTTQKIGNGVFLFAPNNVDVSAVSRLAIDGEGEGEALPWTK
jgi:cell division inhibitor SepF